MLIGLSGYKGSGKDTAAEEFNKIADTPWARVSFAGPLKSVCRSVFGLSEEQVNGKDKETPFSFPIDIDRSRDRLSDALDLRLVERGLVARSPRELLQYVGTEYVRSVDPGYWVRRAVEEASSADNAFITDVRFPDEAKAVQAARGYVIRVERAGVGRTSSHPSEDLDRLPYDFSIRNDGTPEEVGLLLHTMVRWLGDRGLDKNLVILPMKE